MKTQVLAGIAILSLTGFGSATYKYDDNTSARRTLSVTVDKDATETFDVASLTPEAGVTVTNIVKLGEGTLAFTSTDLPNYTFDMVVREGISNIRTTSQYCTNACKITVCDGATLWNSAGGESCTHPKLTTYFQGRGYKGMGALYKNVYNYNEPFGATIVQTGDALVRLMGIENNLAQTVDQQGYALDVHFLRLLGLEWRTYQNIGKLNFIGENSGSDVTHTLNFSSWVRMWSQSANMTFSNVVFAVQTVSSWGSGGACFSLGDPYDFPLTFRAGSSMLINSISPEATSFELKRNFWRGPVEIDEPQLTIKTTVDNSVGKMFFAFTNKVTGGGFNLVGREATKMHLHLYSGENAFTGGVSGVNAVLHDYASGAVPANGAPLALTNSEYVAETATTRALPGAEFNGNGTVRNGYGRWNGALVKSGEGTLTYESSLGADTLNVRGGAFVADLQSQRRAAIAGVKLSTVSNTPAGKTPNNDWDYAKAATYVKNGSETGLTDQGVSLGMDLLYSTAKLPGDMTYCYTGYVWNNSQTNETWSFAGVSTHAFRFDVDETLLIGYWNWYTTLMFKAGFADGSSYNDIGTNTVVLTPGPHRVKFVIMQQHGATTSAQQYSGYYISTDGKFRSGYTGENFELWADAMPIAYRRGPATRDYRQYAKLIDPGDGSLLTFQPLTNAIPEAVGQTAIPQPALAFGSAKFAPGTTATFAGCDQTFANLSGWPTVTDASIAVTTTWTINPAEFGTTSFTIHGKLTLGSDLQFVFPEGKPAPAYRNVNIVLGTATEGIVGTPAKPANEHWRVFVDGQALKAMYQSDGMMVILR